MDLSIVAIIPLYNGAQWIEQSIRSVFAQTLQPDEFIVVDDGSTDGGAGAAIVERLAEEQPVKLLQKKNGGQSSARNFGVRHSTSALIALLDQDDKWYPRHLETLVRPFRESRGIPLGWAYSNLDLINEAGKLLSRSYLSDLPHEHPKRHIVRCLSEDMHVLPGASLISRAAFDVVGGFDERLSGYEDDDLFLRLFCAGYDNVFLDEPLSQWRMVSGSSGHSHRMFKSSLIYFDKLLRDFPDDESCGHYYARDMIGPRFGAYFLYIYARALKTRNIEHQRDACNALAAVLPHLRTSLRLPLQLALPALRSRTAGRAILAARRFA